MKKILFSIILLFFSILSHKTYADNEEEVKTLIYGHTYNKSQTNPLSNFYIYVKKNGEILGETKSNKEGYYEIILDNISEYVNICISSSSFSEIKGVDYCETVRSYQNLGIIINGQKYRELEYDFFTDDSGKNLNQLLEDEITHDSLEEGVKEYEQKIGEAKEEEAKRIELLKIEEEKDALKAEYNIPSIIESSGTKAITIFGTVSKESSSSGVLLKASSTYVRITDHNGYILEDVVLGEYNDFNITLTPKGEDIFLTPLNLEIYNLQKGETEGEKYNLFSSYKKTIIDEKTPINILLESNDELYRIEIVDEIHSFPLVEIIIVIVTYIILTIKHTKNKINTLRNDY